MKSLSKITLSIIFVSTVAQGSYAIDAAEIRMPLPGYSVYEMQSDEAKAYAVTGISNDATLAGASEDDLVTEYAVRNAIDDMIWPTLNLIAAIKQNGTSGSLDVDPYAKVRIGSATNAATFGLEIMKGNNTATVNHRLSGTLDSYLCSDGGSLGIGDSTPSYKLDVNGTARFTGDSRFNSRAFVNTSLIIGGEINYANLDVTGDSLFRASSSSGLGVKIIPSATGNQTISTLNDNLLLIPKGGEVSISDPDVGGNGKLRILYDGGDATGVSLNSGGDSYLMNDLAIGKIDPSYRLDVDGDAAISGHIVSDSINDVSDQGLVLALGMDSRSISGTTLIDSSTYGNNGTASGATHVATGGPNGDGYYSFDGNDDYIHGPSVGVSAYPFTLSSWVKKTKGADAYNSCVSVCVGVDSTKYMAIEVIWGDSLSRAAITARNTTEVFNYATLPTTIWADWVHIVGVFTSATDRKLYINGTLQSVGALTSVDCPAIDKSLVGAVRFSSISRFMNGSISQPRIYNRALSAAEVKAMYDTRASIRPPKLALYSNTTQNVYSPVWFSGDVSALSFTDRTPGWDKSPDAALAAIVATGSKTITIGKGKDIKTKAEIDHDTLPIEAQVVLGVDKATSEVIHGRDLGMMITIQSEAIKALEARLKKLEGGKAVK